MFTVTNSHGTVRFRLLELGPIAARVKIWVKQSPRTSSHRPRKVGVDEETLAAIDRGIKAADEGTVVPLEEVRRRMQDNLV